MTGRSDSAGVLVVGGGIAGLVTAWELALAGRRPHLIESSAALGGCIARHSVGGLALDAGAESFATATPAVSRLIQDLGLADRMVSPNPVGAWVRHAGGSAPLPAAALLGIPARPLAGDVRRVLGVPGSARAALDLLLPAGVGAGRAGSLGALVGRRMGRRVVDRLVEPVAGGVYSTHPDELDVDAAAPRLRQELRDRGSLARAVRRLRGDQRRPGSAVAGLSGGLYELVPTLTVAIESYGGTISTRTEVDAVRNDDGGWAVDTPHGSWSATQLVLAVPGPVAVGLLAELAIAAPVESAATSDVLLVTLVVDAPGLDAHPTGTGVLVSSRAGGVTAKALTHATAKWAWLAACAGPGRHVLRLSYGRGDAGFSPDPARLIELALADAATLTGVELTPAQLVDSAVVRWRSALPRPQPGHRAAMEELRAKVGRRAGLHLAGSMVAGTGLAAVIADARATAAQVLSAARPA